MAYALGQRVGDCTATRFAQAAQILKYSSTKDMKLAINFLTFVIFVSSW